MSATNTETKSGKRPPLSLLQVLTIVGIVVGLLILLDFNRRLAAEQQLVDAANQKRTEVAGLEVEQTVLLTQVAYATTDAAVLQWAHENGKMAQPGEVLVVPVVPTALPSPTPLPPALPTPPPTWILWRNLFIGAIPPLVP